MSEWYVVSYMIGRKFNKLLIYAHDREEAGDVAGIQARHRHSSSAQIKVLSVRTEAEEEEYEKSIKEKIESGCRVL